MSFKGTSSGYSFPAGQDAAFKFGCGRFRMEEHLLERCAEEVIRFGRRPLFVCDDRTYALAYGKVSESLRAAGAEARILRHNGFCCREDALAYADDGVLEGIDVVIGCGGGIVIDFAKCLADIADAPVVTMPTSSATCCAFTPIAVCYTREGRYVSTSFFRREVAAALLDLTVLSEQPGRLLVAGACDAMAKKIEIEFWNSLPGGTANPVASGIASIVSDYIYGDLDRKIDAAFGDVRRGEVTQTLKDVLFSSVVGAGIVSGISGGARQTALAHGFYFFARERYTAQAVRYTHGELVAVGLVLQLAYYGRVQESERFAARLRGWGLAASMGDLGFAYGEEDAAACMDYLRSMDEMKAAGADAVPRLEKALKAVFR